MNGVLRRALAPVVFVAFATASCGDEPAPSGRGRYDGPSPVIIGSSDVTVAIDLRQFAMTVKAADGRTVLKTFAGDRTVAGDDRGAYGAIGATKREREIRPSLVEGYDHVSLTDAPWLHGAAVASVRVASTTADIELFDPAEPDVTMTFSVKVEGADVAVEASVRGKRKDGSVPDAMGQTFLLVEGERVAGLGEREGSVSHRGRRYQCWVEEGGLGGGESVAPSPTNPAPNGPGMTHVPVPFYHSSAGYALWADTSFRTSFSFGSDDPSLLRVDTDEPRLKYRMFVGTPAETLGRFTALTGRATLPAPWVFGPRRRADIGTMVDGVPEVEAFRLRGVPTTMADDTTHFLPNGRQSGRDAEIAAWTANLHRLGYKAIGYFNGHVSTTSEGAAGILADGRAKDLFLRTEGGDEFRTFMISGGSQTVVTIDFTRPGAVPWYESRLQEALDLGYDGWMLDFGEYLPPNARLGNGMTGWEAHNLYPLMLQRATTDYLRRVRGNDWMYFARSGYTGSQAFAPVIWSGDPSASFEQGRGLPAHVRAGISAGLSGIPFWGSDISGFTCLNDPPADKEVYLRWAEFGALSSDMHDENACAGKKEGTSKWTLWSDAETVAVYGAYARLHTRLFPYLYAAAKEAVDTGLPVIRHPLLMHPDVPEAWDTGEEYWFGPSLFVAPVTARGARSRETLLPPGEWFDWWSFAHVNGGRRVTRDAPLDVIPLWQRAGTAIPLLDADVQTLAVTDDPSVVDMSDRANVLDVRVALTASASRAAARLVDGTTLEASRAPGGIVLPNGMTQADESALATCASCARIDALHDGTRRIRVTASSPVAAGGLSLSHARPGPPLRVRWDVLVK